MNGSIKLGEWEWRRGWGGVIPRKERGSLLDKPGEGNTVNMGEEGTQSDTPSEGTTDPEGGSGESRGPEALRLNKPRVIGMMRERPAWVGDLE